MDKANLFQDFDPVSAKAWKQKIQFDLKGADYNNTLVWESPEGIKVKPFYHADNKSVSLDNSKPSGWNIGQTIYVSNAKNANQKAKEFLDKGAESICFILPSEEMDTSNLLTGLADVPIYFEFQFLAVDVIKSLLRSVKNTTQQLFLNIDLIGNLGKTGNWYKNLKEDHKKLDAILHLNVENTIAIDASHYQNAGANTVQQLAYSLSHANEYLNHISDTTAASIKFTFKISVGTNYFFELAKLRALRTLWKTLASVYGNSQDCHIIALPTKRNKTLYDYNTNMLRTTTEAMSAVLGGADVFFNMPYDGIYHKENDFGNRIALNQLVLLKKESYFDKIDNAADGAYYIETLTQQLAEKALVLFKQIERGGGFLSQLKTHTIQKKIMESAKKEQLRFEEKQEVLVGTNKYLNEADLMKDSLELYPFVKKNTRKT